VGSFFRLAAVLAWGAAALGSIELGVWAAVRAGVLEARAPSYGREPERGLRWDAALGAWRAPGSRFREQTPCWDVVYAANSSGARDAEREPRSGDFRVVMLGDAFEGRGVSAEERVSDRLERDTGHEHLNFAGRGGLEASARVYRELASHYDHSALIVAITPARELWPAGDDPLRPGWRRALRRWSWSWNALEAAIGRAPGSRLEPAADAQGRELSRFYDFAEASVAALQARLLALHEQSGLRPMVLVLVPTLSDLLRYEESDADPLGSRLLEFARAHSIAVVDLLPLMAAHAQQYERYFFSACGEEHWNAYGNAVAFEYLRDALRGDFHPDEIHAQR
jgi:hypothetical protein